MIRPRRNPRPGGDAAFELEYRVMVRLHVPLDLYLAFKAWGAKAKIYEDRAGGGMPDSKRRGWIRATLYFPARHERRILKWLRENITT